MSTIVEREVIDLVGFDDLEPGVINTVRVGDNKTVALVRTGESVSVFHPICPHFYAPLEYGVVHNVLDCDKDGHLEVDGERWAITCPWHRWEFDLNDGSSLCGQAEHIRIYDSEIVDGRVKSRLIPQKTER